MGLLAVLLVFALGPTVQAGDREIDVDSQEGISILIVDRSGNFAASMGTELLARNLRNQLSADVEARREIPNELREEKSFEIVFVVSEKVPQVWVLTGFLPYKVPADKQRALEGVHKLANKVYNRENSPKRKVVGIVDDLAPAAWASYLTRYGWLGQMEKPQTN
jgi:hypothetical protein